MMPDDRIISKFLYFAVEWNDCLLSLDNLDKDGYAQWRQMRHSKREKFKAHRVVWEWFNGPIPDRQIVLHSCDNRPCVNIAHLSLGTQPDNLADMRAKGRSVAGVRQPYMG